MNQLSGLQNIRNKDVLSGVVIIIIIKREDCGICLMVIREPQKLFEGCLIKTFYDLYGKYAGHGRVPKSQGRGRVKRLPAFRYVKD